jgi:hypothetical protein
MEILRPLKGPFYAPHISCAPLPLTQSTLYALSLQWTSLQPACMMDYIFTLLMSTGDDYITFLPNIAEPIESTHLFNTDDHNLHTHGQENCESYVV